MKIKKFIRSYLSFSKSEVKGTLVLIPLIVFFILAPFLYRQFFGIKYYTQIEDKRLLDSLVSLIDQGFNDFDNDVPIHYFKFNPNLASVEELNSLGVPSFLSKRIDNYRSKGGKFSVKRDLLKIFDFPDTLYRALEEYIDLPNKSILAKTKTYVKPRAQIREALVEPKRVSSKRVEPTLVLSLNMSDTSDLKRMKGIGSSYAKRIIGYRNLLGGFHSLGQLKEVYGMTDTLYQAIIPYLVITDSVVNKLPINIATFKELLAHPYIDYEQTKEILNLKSSKGKFMNADDLYRLKLMDSVTIRKLIPYIRF